MIKIKVNNIKENEDISVFYADDGPDMTIPDREITDQLPDNSYRGRGSPISNYQTATSPSPTDKDIEEELELDEDLLFEELIYEKKDRCYHLAKQKYDVFPSAYASGFIVRCRKGKVGKRKKKKVNESSQYSQKLSSLVSQEQELRNKFSEMMDKEGGWSQELLNKFMKVYKTQPHDVFNSERVEKELVSLAPNFDYENFSDEDWDNFWLLSQHADKHPDFQKNALKIIKKYKGKDSKEYKKLLFRLGSNKGSIKNKEGTPVDLDKIDDMGIDWDNVVSSLNEGTFDKEKSQGLHGWFARKGGKGKSKGWVDCNTCRTNPKTGRKTCQTCGRTSGEKRSKYPACRPTPSACTKAGTSRKKSSMRVSWKSKKRD